MAKKEDILDRRTLDRYRKQISDDFDSNYREKMVKDLSEEIYKDVQKNFDVDYKKQLVENVTNDIYDEVKEKVNKEERKVSSHKSFKIFRLSIYILVLIGCILYVMYRLYVTNNLAIIKYNYQPSKCDTPDTTEPVTEPKKEEIDYKALYGYLIDDIKIYDLSLYTGTNNISDMELSKRLTIAYSLLSKDDIEVDGTINILRASLLKSAYTKLFGLDDYENTAFSVNGLNYIYSNNKNEYIAIKGDDYNKDIKYELADASVDDNNIYVKAYVALTQDKKIYNVITEKEVGGIDDKLSDHKAKLSTITFVFNKDKKLIGLSNN